MEPACSFHPTPWADLFLSPSTHCFLRTYSRLVPPEPCGARPGAAGSWLRWGSSADRCCRQQTDLSSVRPCGSAGVPPGRKSCHTRGSSDVSSGSVSVELEDPEMSGDTRYSGGDFRSESFYD